MANISEFFGKVALTGKKYAPELLLAAGVAGGIATVVLACKETLKAQEVIERHNSEIEQIHEAADIAKPGEYPAEVQKKDITATYIRTGVAFAKTYMPAIVVGTGSVIAIFASFGIMKKRYLGMVAAYGALDKLFKDYRKRVVDTLGEEKDREFRYGLTKESVKMTVDNGDGKIKTETVENEVSDGENAVNCGYSPYARFFMAGNPNFEKDSESNRFFLSRQQDWFNQKLQARGYVFLNEVYEALGFEPTKAGQVVGWVKGMGDDFIDFGMFNVSSEATMRFINGDEDVVILDFNVDGPILDTVGFTNT